jgi:uncharacterized Zn finger protein
MPRETAFDKGRRLVAEGRLRVRRADERQVLAEVVGDSAVVHRCGLEPNREWCTCPAKGTCSHLIGLQLVTFRPLPLDGPGKEGIR